MQQTFISAYGKVIFQNGILYIRNLKPVFTFSQFIWFAFRISIILRFVLYLFEEDSPKRNTGLVLFSILSIFYGIELVWHAYKAVFLQSFSNRIPIRNIISYRLEDDPNELEAHLYLILRSGRERKLTFRKLEKQQEALVELLSLFIMSVKSA